jgi:hypothetical protein
MVPDAASTGESGDEGPRVDPEWQQDPDERAFWRLYGPWDPMTPHEAAQLLDGWDAPWWVAGGGRCGRSWTASRR